jgi:transcriptional regulator with XRE-family HTH domain
VPQWSDYSTGERVRSLRGSEMTQQGLAEAADVSLSLVQKVEQTSKASIGSLLKLAAALKVEIGVVLGQQSPRQAMNRRDRAALREVESAVHDSALRLIPEGIAPSDIPSLKADLAAARSQYWAANHVEIADTLPKLLLRATVLADESAGDSRREAQRILADAYRLAALVGNQFGARNLAYGAMTQAKIIAEACGDELLFAAQDVTLARILMRDSKMDQAITLSLKTAARIEPSFSKNDPDRMAVYGKLMIRAAVAASRQEDRDRANDYMSQAHAAAARVGREITAHETPFGPTTASTEAVAVALALGEVGKAMKLIKTTEGADALQGCRGCATSCRSRRRSARHGCGIRARTPSPRSLMSARSGPSTKRW